MTDGWDGKGAVPTGDDSRMIVSKLNVEVEGSVWIVRSPPSPCTPAAASMISTEYAMYTTVGRHGSLESDTWLYVHKPKDFDFFFLLGFRNTLTCANQSISTVLQQCPDSYGFASSRERF
jgi:hypothetical protein